MVGVYDDLNNILFQNEINPRQINQRDKMDFDEDGTYFRFETQKFDNVNSHFDGIYEYEILKKNNIDKINNDLFGLFPEFWDQEKNNLNNHPESEPKLESIEISPVSNKHER